MFRVAATVIFGAYALRVAVPLAYRWMLVDWTRTAVNNVNHHRRT